MPLLRAAAPRPDEISPETPPEGREVHLARLASGDADVRRRAAQVLAGDPAASAALAACLPDEPARSVRDALFASLVETGGTLVAGLIAPLLRGEDAGLRNSALDALKHLEADAVPVLDLLLADPDPDVRILAVEVTRAWPSALAVPRLQRVLANDPHLNVCVAAVDVATEVGTSDLIGTLADLRRRFAGDPFMVFAVEIACARINGTDGHAGGLGA